MSDIRQMKGSEKAIGGGIALAVAGAVGYGLYRMLPFLIELAQNTITFIAELVVLGIVLMVVCDRSFWLSLYYGWKNVARKMRQAIVREDPIGILDTVIARFGARLEEIKGNMAKADGARKRQDNAIKDCYKKRDESLGLATAAQRQGRAELEVARYATAADRWEKAADDMKPLAKMLLDMQVRMQQAQELCEARLGDMQDQKAVLSIKLETMKNSQTAVKSFKRFFGTNPDMQMMQMSVDEIERQSTEAEAEIDQFMRNVQPMIEQGALQKQAEAEQAMSKFGKFLTTATPTTTLLDAGPVAVKEKR